MNSKTTIYHEAVARDDGDNYRKECELPAEQTNAELDNVNELVQTVDSEVAFKIKAPNRRGSSSSEEQIDTSDELLDVDNFIADCQREAGKKPTQTKLPRPYQGDEYI